MSEKEEEPPPSAVQAPLANNGQTGTQASIPPRFHAVSWFAQFYWCLWKNYLILSRRPIVLLLVLFSSVFAMLLSWGTRGRDPQDEDVLYPTADAFNDCGSLRPEYINSMSYEDQTKLQLTLNENWRDGGAVAFMGLGAMVHGLFAFRSSTTKSARSSWVCFARSVFETVSIGSLGISLLEAQLFSTPSWARLQRRFYPDMSTKTFFSQVSLRHSSF
jgi:hypothetical protein